MPRAWPRNIAGNMVFVDANVLLELLLPDRPRVREVARVLSETQRPGIVTLTAHLAWHFGRQAHVSDAIIAKQVALFELLPLTPADYAWAVANEQGKDFEDALQVAATMSNHCTAFITLDRDLVKRYKHLPIEFIVPGK